MHVTPAKYTALSMWAISMPGLRLIETLKSCAEKE